MDVTIQVIFENSRKNIFELKIEILINKILKTKYSQIDRLSIKFDFKDNLKVYWRLTIV